MRSIYASKHLTNLARLTTPMPTHHHNHKQRDQNLKFSMASADRQLSSSQAYQPSTVSPQRQRPGARKRSQSTQPTKRKIVHPPPPHQTSHPSAQHHHLHTNTTHHQPTPPQSRKETGRERREEKGGRPPVSIHTTQAPGVSCQSQKRSLKIQTASHNPSHYTRRAMSMTGPASVPAAGHGTSPAPTAQPPTGGPPEDPRPTRQAESST